MRRLPVCGVMGSGSEPHTALAGPLGEWIARAGLHLLTGGGAGAMQAVGEAFVGVSPREGINLGVLPGPSPRPGYPNPFVELVVRTHLPHSGADGLDPMSRNHVNVLTADVVVALPGSAGTRSEVELARRYGRPIHLFGPVGAFTGFPEVPRAGTLDELTAWITSEIR